MSPFRPQPLFTSPESASPEASDAASPTLADVFRRYGDAYLATHSVTTSPGTWGSKSGRSASTARRVSVG
ncbi:MAG: hypothetical protein GY801_46755 [bacterium]|nr:hypothetical protein [bacterium]